MKKIYFVDYIPLTVCNKIYSFLLDLFISVIRCDESNVSFYLFDFIGYDINTDSFCLSHTVKSKFLRRRKTSLYRFESQKTNSYTVICFYGNSFVYRRGFISHGEVCRKFFFVNNRREKNLFLFRFFRK